MEVLSSDRAADMVVKSMNYAGAQRVAGYWIADLEREAIDVPALADGICRLICTVRAGQAIEVDLGAGRITLDLGARVTPGFRRQTVKTFMTSSP